jgi:hypothetical protein
VWISFGAIETNSMVSGWSQWDLGRVTPTVVCDSSRIDQVGTTQFVYRYDASRRRAAMANWIRLADTNVDLLPLAVRTAAGLDIDLTDYGYSPTLEYKFVLDLEPDEIEPFLDLLRKHHGAEVDRYLRP